MGTRTVRGRPLLKKLYIYIWKTMELRHIHTYIQLVQSVGTESRAGTHYSSILYICIWRNILVVHSAGSSTYTFIYGTGASYDSGSLNLSFFNWLFMSIMCQLFSFPSCWSRLHRRASTARPRSVRRGERPSVATRTALRPQFRPNTSRMHFRARSVSMCALKKLDVCLKKKVC